MNTKLLELTAVSKLELPKKLPKIFESSKFVLPINSVVQIKGNDVAKNDDINDNHILNSVAIRFEGEINLDKVSQTGLVNDSVENLHSEISKQNDLYKHSVVYKENSCSSEKLDLLQHDEKNNLKSDIKTISQNKGSFLIDTGPVNKTVAAAMLSEKSIGRNREKIKIIEKLNIKSVKNKKTVAPSFNKNIQNKSNVKTINSKKQNTSKSKLMYNTNTQESKQRINHKALESSIKSNLTSAKKIISNKNGSSLIDAGPVNKTVAAAMLSEKHIGSKKEKIKKIEKLNIKPVKNKKTVAPSLNKNIQNKSNVKTINSKKQNTSKSKLTNNSNIQEYKQRISHRALDSSIKSNLTSAKKIISIKNGSSLIDAGPINKTVAVAMLSEKSIRFNKKKIKDIDVDKTTITKKLDNKYIKKSKKNTLVLNTKVQVESKKNISTNSLLNKQETDTFVQKQLEFNGQQKNNLHAKIFTLKNVLHKNPKEIIEEVSVAKSFNFNQTVSAPITKVSYTGLVSRISDVIVQSISLSNTSQAIYKIDGGELGDIEIKLSQEQAAIKATIIVETDSAKSSMDKLLQTIKENLLNKGIKVDSFSVNVNSEGENKSHKAKTFQHPLNMDFTLEGETEINTTMPQVRRFGYNTLEVMA